MNMKQIQLVHVTWCSSLLSQPLFKGGIVIASARPSVCMFCSILLNHWTKSNQNWCARFSYEWGVRQHFFWAIPLGPHGGFKCQLSDSKSQFQRFYTKLYVCSQNKRNGIFIMSPGSYSRGLDLGLLVGQFFPYMVLWHIKLKGMVSRTGNKLNVHPMVKLVTLRYSQ